MLEHCRLQSVIRGVHSRVRTRYTASGTTHTRHRTRVRRTVSPYRRVWPSTSTPTTTRAGYTTTRPICSTLPLSGKNAQLNTVSTGTASHVRTLILFLFLFYFTLRINNHGIHNMLLIIKITKLPSAVINADKRYNSVPVYMGNYNNFCSIAC